MKVKEEIDLPKRDTRIKGRSQSLVPPSLESGKGPNDKIKQVPMFLTKLKFLLV